MANQGTSQGDKCFVDVVAPFEPEFEPAELVHPAFSALDDVTVDAQAAAVLGVAPSQLRDNSALSEVLAVRVRVIRAISQDLVRSEPRVPALATHRLHCIDQGQKLVDVVPVGGRDRKCQRCASLGVNQQVMFGPVFTAVHGARSRFFPRCIARTEAESITARDQSILPAAWSCSRRIWCSRFQTPAFFQSRKRRQQVMPLPQRISCGKYSQGIPVLRTNRMPVSTARSGTRGRPPLRCGTLRWGNSGLISRHKSSSKTFLVIVAPPLRPDFRRLGRFC